MKKSIHLAILLSFLAFQTNAKQISLDARMDFESFGSNEAAGKPAYSIYKINRLKIDFGNSLNELTDFRIRIDPAKVGDSTVVVSKREGISSHIDFAYISRKISDEWTLSMGKIISGMGGVEGSINPGDNYLRTLAGDEIGKIFWPVGAQLQGKFGDHKININGFNITSDVYDNNTSRNLTNTSSTIGFVYMGKLSEGMILPNISYHSEEFNDVNYIKNKKSYLAIGSAFKMDGFEVELDYLNNNRDYSTQSNEILNSETMVALGRYLLSDGSVLLKIESSAQKTATSSTESSKSAVSGMTLAYEFKPVKEDNWRAHVAATQRSEKPDGSDVKIERKVFVGMRIYADFLK